MCDNEQTPEYKNKEKHFKEFLYPEMDNVDDTVVTSHVLAEQYGRLTVEARLGFRDHDSHFQFFMFEGIDDKGKEIQEHIQKLRNVQNLINRHIDDIETLMRELGGE